MTLPLISKIRHRLSHASGIPDLRHELAQARERERQAGPASAASQAAQVALAARWREAARAGGPAESFADVEFRAYSQNGEDGILLYLFSVLGTTNRVAVEICAGDGIECLAANLVVNHGFNGLLVDGDDALLAGGRAFYASNPSTFSLPPTLAQAWIDRETVNDLIAGHGIRGSIDLLSIDLDGVDYWIWDAIEVIQPRVVVVETQCLWGSERAVTVPYARDFRSPLVNGFGVYSGGSLPAFVKLGKRKGYRLVGVQRLGFNAFFVRDDVGHGGPGGVILPEVDASIIDGLPFVVMAKRDLRGMVEGMEWVEV
jgi:hypothetical protein